ncbi:uncharacterized protein [Haliotis cracherodii]|uniref:uncharacterized protein n=1 Tax=Haliotis cracherodii TaxID=6455 RepID=UPI0039EA5AE2
MGSIIDSRVLCFLVTTIASVLAIDCYVCTSVDRSNRDCEDPFNHTRKTFHLIERHCMYGFFRGTHCIKLNGHREDGSHILVRHCSNDNWGSHCGLIRFEYERRTEKIYGCLESCDHDGCNDGVGVSAHIITTLLSSIAVAFVVW